jgi:3-hydroxy-9,10-secoandrosta-1,3,5(10)-triene-9,17-dione monooxygenase
MFFMMREEGFMTDVTLDELVQRARDLVPTLKERARETENLRQLPDETMADLHRLGLLKYYQPKMFGGYEMDWGAHAAIASELARGCTSTAWIQCVVGAHTWMAARFDLEAQKEMFADPDVLIATAFAGGRNVEVERVDGGFKLSGEWSFASGLSHSEWAIVGSQTKSATRDEYEMTLFALPKGDFSQVDNWYVSGLKGTGSMNIKIDNAFIPEHRSIPISTFDTGTSEGAKAHECYSYHAYMPEYFFSVPLGPILGTAIGAMESYLEITKNRFGAMFGEKVAEQIPVQTRIAESSAEIAAAQLLFDRVFETLHARGSKHERVTKSELVRLKRDCVFVGKLCSQAVTRLVKMMGASGLSDTNPVQRFHRDMEALTAHQSQQWEIGMTPIGRWALGLATENKVIDSAPDGDGNMF